MHVVYLINIKNIQYFYGILLEAQIRYGLTYTSNKHLFIICYFGDHQMKTFRNPNIPAAWK